MSSRVVRKKDATPAPEPESEPVPEPGADIDLSWADEREMPILGDIERDMKEMKVAVVGIKRSEETQLADGKALVKLDVEVLAPVKEGKRIVKRRFRLLWPDAVWSSADSGHRVCNGRGYVLTGTDGYGKSRPMPVEVPDPDPKKDPYIEYRVSCACASARFRRRHPEIIFDNSYGFIPLEGAGAKAISSALEIAEFEAESAVAEEIKVNGEERLREQISALLVEAGRHEAEAVENDAEIARAMAERQAVIDELQALIDKDLQPQREALRAPIEIMEKLATEADARLRDTESATSIQIETAEAALAELRAKASEDVSTAAKAADEARRTYKKLAHATDVETHRIDGRIKELRTQIDRVPMPGRLGRLRREKRIHLERAAELRTRIAKKSVGIPVTPQVAPEEASP